MGQNEAFNMQKFIMSVVLVGVTLVIGIFINQTLGENMMDTNTADSVINESAYVNTTGYTVDEAGALDGVYTATAVWGNATSGTPTFLIPVANYTFSNAGVLTNASIVPNAIWYDDANISYSWLFTNTTSSSDAADEIVAALATGTSWISILVVVGFATIVLTMLTSGLGNAARRENEVPYY